MADNPSSDGFLAKNKIVLIVGSLVILAFALVVLRSRDDPESAEAVPTTVAGDEDAPQTTTLAGLPSSDVPPLDCAQLLTTQEMFSALGADEDPSIVDGASGSTRGETCRQTLARGENWFVEISPGGPSDFGTGAHLLGVTGQEVAGVGEGALWFGGSSAEGDGAYGVLTVTETSQHGQVYFRVFLGRPDLGPTQQQEIAIGLALTALPRFPGIAVDLPEPPQPELVAFDDEPVPDTSADSLDSNLLDREARGEWSRGEGLVAILGVLAGEADESEVFGDIEFADDSASIVLFLARDYLETGDDQEAQAEIDRLLDLITLTDDELASLTARRLDSGLILSLASLNQEEVEIDCTDPEEERCLELVPLPDRQGVPANKYRLYAPLGETAWTARHIETTKRAILEAAAKYEPLGKMPVTTVLLEPETGKLFVDSGPEDCKAHIPVNIAAQLEGDGRKFQQLIAREMAYCFVGTEFRALISPDPVGTRWWSKGLVTYLSGFVFPAANAEHDDFPAFLARIELSTTIDTLSVVNWVLFEFIHSQLGIDGNLSTIRSFPAGGDHLAAFAALSDTAELFHQFRLALTDTNVDDLGPGTVPYEPRSWDLDVFVPVEATFAVPAFGVRRIHVKVANGRRGCLETSATGPTIASWRDGAPGEKGDWSQDPPPFLEGEMTLVVTTLAPDVRFTVLVTEVTEDGDCGEEQKPTTTTLGDCGECPPSQYFYND